EMQSVRVFDGVARRPPRLVRRGKLASYPPFDGGAAAEDAADVDAEYSGRPFRAVSLEKLDEVGFGPLGLGHQRPLPLLRRYSSQMTATRLTSSVTAPMPSSTWITLSK